MTQKITGYHGTTSESAQIILEKNQYFISNDEEEWLGPGVYFFENDYLQAEFWCTKAKKYTSWKVLMSEIEAESVIDLTMLENILLFQRVAKSIKNRYLKRKDGKPRTLTNAVVVNAIYEMKAFDVIKATFQVPSTDSVDRTNIVPMQIQVCVRNRNCIKTISEVNRNEQ